MSVFTFKVIHAARADLVSIQNYTRTHHGSDGATAYGALIRQAFKDIHADPYRPGSKERPELAPSVRSYHVAISRDRAPHRIKRPRHVILYHLPKADEIVVLRVLHDSRDLARHLPGGIDQ